MGASWAAIERGDPRRQAEVPDAVEEQSRRNRRRCNVILLCPSTQGRLKSSRKRRFAASAKLNMRKNQYDCMTKDMEHDYIVDHDADADDGASSKKEAKKQ